MKRALGEKQAEQCERGGKRRCRCRCKKRLHGARRGPVWALPVGDPHHIAALCVGKRANGRRCEQGAAMVSVTLGGPVCVEHGQVELFARAVAAEPALQAVMSGA